MNNFVSLFVAVLSHLELLTEDEAKKLVKELHTMTIPDDYEGAHRVVKEIFEKTKLSKKKDLL